MKQYSAKCTNCGRYSSFNAESSEEAKAKWELFKPCGCQSPVEVDPMDIERWKDELMDDIGDTNV